MGGYVGIPGAAAFFFFSAWLTMVFWGIIGPQVGLGTIGYSMAMLVIIALWLIMAPVVAAISGQKRPRW